MTEKTLQKSKKGGVGMNYVFFCCESATDNCIDKFVVANDSKVLINGLLLPNKVITIYQVMTGEEELKQTIEFFEKLGLRVHYSGYENEVIEKMFKSIDRMDVYKRSASFEIFNLVGTKNPFSIFD